MATSGGSKEKVATVNGTVITRGEYDAEMSRYERQIAMSGKAPDPSETSEMKKRVLEGLVDRQGWYDRVLMAAAQADPFRTPAGLRQTEFVTESLHRLSRRVQWLQGQWDRLGLGPFPGQTLAHALHQGCQWVESGDMDRLVQEIRSVGRPAKPKHEDGDPAWAITQGVCEAASEFTGLAGLAVLCPGYVQAVWQIGRAHV